MTRRGRVWKELGPQAALRKSQVVDAELQVEGLHQRAPREYKHSSSRTFPAVRTSQERLGTALSPESTLLQLTGSRLWGRMLPSFPAPEALKRHTQGPILNHIPLSINACCWKRRCMITLGESDQRA